MSNPHLLIFPSSLSKMDIDVVFKIFKLIRKSSLHSPLINFKISKTLPAGYRNVSNLPVIKCFDSRKRTLGYFLFQFLENKIKITFLENLFINKIFPAVNCQSFFLNCLAQMMVDANSGMFEHIIFHDFNFGDLIKEVEDSAPPLNLFFDPWPNHFELRKQMVDWVYETQQLPYSNWEFVWSADTKISKEKGHIWIKTNDPLLGKFGFLDIFIIGHSFSVKFIPFKYVRRLKLAAVIDSYFALMNELKRHFSTVIGCVINYL